MSNISASESRGIHISDTIRKLEDTIPGWLYQICLYKETSEGEHRSISLPDTTSYVNIIPDSEGLAYMLLRYRRFDQGFISNGYARKASDIYRHASYAIRNMLQERSLVNADPRAYEAMEALTFAAENPDHRFKPCEDPSPTSDVPWVSDHTEEDRAVIARVIDVLYSIPDISGVLVGACHTSVDATLFFKSGSRLDADLPCSARLPGKIQYSLREVAHMANEEGLISDHDFQRIVAVI